MSHVFLSHLSKDNNDPDLVHQLFSAKAGKMKVVVASRYVETPVYHITSDTTALNRVSHKVEQMSLF